MATSDQASAGNAGIPDLPAVQPARLAGDQTRTLFGQVIGRVAATIGFTALGAYIGRDLTGGTGILFFALGFACIFGLRFATARRREQLVVGLLFGLGLPSASPSPP